MTNTNWLEIGGYIITLLVLFPFIAYGLATMDLFWTLLESGNIKYIYRGDTLRKIIADVKGKKMENHKLIDGQEKKTWIQEKLGIYWVGIWPFASVKKFKVKRRKEEEDTVGKPPTKWIRNMDELEVDSLRAAFPRPFLLEKVELGDRQTVDILAVGKFEVVDAYIPVVQLKGEFFELTSSILQGTIIDICERIRTMDKFIEANKGEGGILVALTRDPGKFNRILIERVGLRLTGITIPQWDPSDTKVRDAMNARFIAEKEREKILVEADAYKQRVNMETEADTARVKAMGIAAGEQIKQKVAALASSLGSPDLVTQGVASLLEMEAAASSTSKLTTFVKNGGTPVVVPVGGGKP